MVFFNNYVLFSAISLPLSVDFVFSVDCFLVSDTFFFSNCEVVELLESLMLFKLFGSSFVISSSFSSFFY